MAEAACSGAEAHAATGGHIYDVFCRDFIGGYCVGDVNIKGTVHPKIKIHISPLMLFINLDCFGVSCLVVEISAVKISAFSLI